MIKFREEKIISPCGEAIVFEKYFEDGKFYQNEKYSDGSQSGLYKLNHKPKISLMDKIRFIFK